MHVTVYVNYACFNYVILTTTGASPCYSSHTKYQAGFHPGRSCAEQAFSLKTMLKIRAKRKAPTICTFIDFKYPKGEISEEF